MLELLCILEVMDSNLDPEAGYLDSGLSWSYLDTPSKCQDNNLKLVIINCFLFLSNSLSTDNPKIRCHTPWAAAKASLNKSKSVN